jgi:hypothetical protein
LIGDLNERNVLLFAMNTQSLAETLSHEIGVRCNQQCKLDSRSESALASGLPPASTRF